MPFCITSAGNISFSKNLPLEKCQLDWIIYTVVIPVVLVVGTVSNGVTLHIFRTGKFRKSAIGHYMKVYCVMNLLCLYFAYGLTWFAKITKLRSIDSLSDIGCRLYTFISVVLVFIGPWLLVAMSIDRYINLRHPVQAVNLTTQFMAKVTTVIVSVGVIVVSVHAMWVSELQQDICGPDIDLSSGHATLHTEIFSWLNAICNQYVPTILLVIFSFTISIQICRLRSEDRRRNNERKRQKLTFAVLALSIICLIFTLPVLSVHIVNINLNHGNFDKHLSAKTEQITKIVDILAYGNQIMVLFVCTTFSETFRKELLSILPRSMFSCTGKDRNSTELEVTVTESRISIHSERNEHETATQV